jgi:putative two-component system response regulator
MELGMLYDLTSYRHSEKVSEICKILARAAGFSEAEEQLVSQAALFHDIGKTSIPVEILQKPGPLTEAEFKIVKTHTEIGHSRLSEALKILQVADTVAQFHHEKLDGRGYYELSGGEVPFYARMVAVADVFDALVSKRAYKPAWDVQSVCEYLQRNSGSEFDPTIVRLLLSVLDPIMELYKSGQPDEAMAVSE